MFLSTAGIIANPIKNTVCVPIQGVDSQIGTYSTTVSNQPFYGLFNYSVGASLYASSDIGSAKQLTAVQIQQSGFTLPYQVLNQEIWIGQTFNATFPSSTPQVDFSDLEFYAPLKKVKSSFTYDVVNGAWNTITFDTPYCWDGNYNLLFVWKNYDGAWQSGYGNVQVGNVVSKGMYKGFDANYPTGTGTRTNFPVLVKFNY